MRFGWPVSPHPNPLLREEGEKENLLHSENEPRLQLKHPRRVDVCERRDRVRGRADRHELTEGRGRYGCVAEHRLSAPEEVPVIEEIEALQSEQDARSL